VTGTPDPAPVAVAAARSARPNLPQLARQTLTRLVGQLRERDPDAAAWVESVRAARPESPTVVVVGETNRGKSSLVNALVATPGLSPVDAGVATAVYLVLRHGPEWSARACWPGVAEPVPVELAAVPAWVSADRDPPDGMLPPRYVEITGPVPLLERVSIVDTPGVGGLHALHGELAAEAAETATALLFTLDSSSPMTAGEMDFLRRLSDRVETVLFALTKTDVHRGWQQILAANRDLLARHAPRFADAPWYPVSARLFDTAAGAPNPRVATVLRERSGIAELQTALQRAIAGRAGMLAEANGLRAVSTALGGVIAGTQARQRALSTGHEEAEALRRRRDELNAARRASGRSWQLRLRGEVARARVESQHDVANQLRTMSTWFRSAVDTADRTRLAALPAELDAALQLVSGRVSTGLAQRLSRLADAALADLFTPDELAAVRAAMARQPRPPVVMRAPEQRPSTAEDKLLLAMGVSGGVGISRLATLPLAGLGAAAGLVVLPVTIVLGLGAGWWMARVRRHAADKQYVKQWLADVVADARATLDQVVAEQLIDVEQQLSLALDDALAKRIAVTEDELREVDRALRLDTAERSRELEGVRRILAGAESGRREADSLLATIRELRDRA
jgi:hypothetical protein